MFFGRAGLLLRILNVLHQNSVMICGERRMGKTSVLYQLADLMRRSEDPEWVFIPVYVDLEGTPQHRFFRCLMDAIWGTFQVYAMGRTPRLRLTEPGRAEYTDREFMADLRQLLDLLKEVAAPRKLRVVLLLDEIDVVGGYDSVIQQQLRRVFMSPLAAHLGAVVAGTQIAGAWDRPESPWYNMFNEAVLEPFSPKDARETLRLPVRGVYQWEPAALDFVIARAQGRPHRLQQYGLEAVNRMLAVGRRRIMLADVQAAHDSIGHSCTA